MRGASLLSKPLMSPSHREFGLVAASSRLIRSGVGLWSVPGVMVARQARG